jgi:hypothetical protein
MAGTLTTLQCSLINSGAAFTIKNTQDLGFPMAPATTAKFVDQGEKIKIRTVVFIDSAAGNDPNSLTFSCAEDGNTLEIGINYNYREESPTTFSCFYVELEYSSDTVSSLTTVCAKLVDLDPKTSRGTYTTVSPS